MILIRTNCLVTVVLCFTDTLSTVRYKRIVYKGWIKKLVIVFMRQNIN